MEPGSGSQTERGHARRLGAAAVLLGGSALLSRLLGYAREVALAAQIGPGPETDAYYAAFMVPDLLNYLLAGGALAVAFIPLYSRVVEADGVAGAERLFANVLGLTGAVSLVAAVALWIGAERLVALQFPRFDPETQALTVRLTRIVLPAQFFFLTGGIVRAVLMAHGRFGSQAMAPLLYNGAIIAGGLWTGTVEGFAWGVLAGAAFGPWLVPLLDLRRNLAVRARVRLAPRDRLLRTYLWIALPLMLGLSLATVDEWYDKWFGALLSVGTVADLSFARRLMQAPVAVVGQAVAAAALPTLSHLWASGRIEQLNRTLLGTLQAVVTLAVLAGCGFFALAEPIVRLVYQYGRFGPDDTLRVAPLLAVFSLGVPGWVTQQVAARAFYAREDTWRPMLLSSAVALAAVPAYLAAGRAFAAPGLAAAGAAAMTANALLTLAWARRRHGGPSLRAFFGTAGRAAAVGLVAAVVAHGVQPGAAGHRGAILDLVVGGAAFAAFGLAGVWLAGDAAMRDAIRGLGAGVARRLPGLRRTP